MEYFLRDPKSEKPERQGEGEAEQTPAGGKTAGDQKGDADKAKPGDAAGDANKPKPGDAADADKRKSDGPNAATLLRQHGVMLKRDGDKLVAKLKANGQEILLGDPFEKSKEGYAATDALLKKLEDEKKADLTTRYGVSFGAEGEDVEKQVLKVNPDQTFERGEMVKARAPRLSELYGVEAALENAKPSHTSLDGKAVKFYFLKDKYVQRDDDSTKANFTKTDKDGRPAVYIWPKATDGMELTEKDDKQAVQLDSYTVQSLLTHELGHNSIYRLGWETEKTLIEACKRLGWAPYDDQDSKETVWLIQGKKNDFYKMLPDGQTWIGTNAQGKPVDKDGKVVKTDDEAVQLTANEVRERALYPPPTEYLDNAVEVAAEAFMMMRVSKERREALLMRSPVIYDYIKSKDQEDIDLAYGKDGKDGKGDSKMVRIPEGTVVANTPENQKLIKQFEEETNKKRVEQEKLKADAAKAEADAAKAKADTAAAEAKKK